MKKNKGNINIATLICIIVIIILLMLIGFLLYQNYLLKNTKYSSTAISESAKYNAVAVTNEGDNSSAVMTSNERYAIWVNGLKNSIAKLQETEIEFEGETIVYNKNGQSDTGVNSLEVRRDVAYLNIDSGTEYAKKYGKRYKIGNNIIKGGIVATGNGGAAEIIWYLNDKGELYIASISTENIFIEFKENKKLKNIVEIVETADATALEAKAIDIDGKIYNLY